MANTAQFEIFFEIDKATYRINQESSEYDDTNKLRGLIAPRDVANVGLSAITTKSTFENGRMSVIVRYGRERGELTHKMESILEFSAAAYPPEDAGGEVAILRNVLSIDYEQLKKAS